MNDSLTLVSEKRLRELLKIEKELKAAREVVEAIKFCGCVTCDGIKRAVNEYDQVVGGG